MFLSPEEIRQQIDLSGEQNRFVSLIERENGQKTFLRMYNDMAKFPSETEISAAMKRLVRPAIKIAYLSGHGERDINKQGDQGYFLYTQDITFRNSLVNNGFDVMTLNIQEEGKIPDDLDILFISELRQPLSSEEQAEIARYIAEGGNLIVACEAGSQDHINPLLAPFGISFLPGRVMQKSENFAPSLVFSQMSKEMEQASGDFSWMNRWKYRVPMPNVVGIQYTATENVTVTPFMHTITTETCWQELETTDYMAKDAVLNTEAGETAGTFHTSVLVSRKLSNKEQRLWVVGDADLFSNGELMQRRRGVNSGENKRVMEYAMQFMTEGNFPVDTDRKGSPDRGINIGLESLMPIKVGFMGVFPALLAIFGIAIQIRRKRK
jgi:ABC-2 type transport system permease protein